MVKRMVPATGCRIVAAAMAVAGPFACGGETSKEAVQAGGQGSQTATSVETGGSASITSASGGSTNAANSDVVAGGVAGSTGSSETAGVAAVAGATRCRCDSPNCGACPIDRSVPVDAGDRSYRIDATEVTNRDYAAFVAA